jgi:AraC-like DNA-binding protein
MTEPIKNALLYISENFDSVNERDAAAFCGLSYNHFSASFKKTVGRSFSDYLTLIRINEAEKLLLSTEKSITDIALSCGFSSTSHFISRFKEKNGVTPGQLRKKTR